MSGRSRHLRDRVLITNRKTDRRQSPARPIKERLQEIAIAGKAEQGTRVRMAFILPASLQPMISTGALDGGLEVLARGFVRIASWSAEKCFNRAQAFLRDVAKDKPAFTTTAVILNVDRPFEHYSRHLTVVRGAIVVSVASQIEPKVFEAA